MDGILIVDKPKGMTSHDVVDFVRRRFGIKKAGHGGTLDPMATGVLVILIGKATKTSATHLGDDKEYEAVMTLGSTSDTGDAFGKITPTGVSPERDEARIRGVVAGFTGEVLQKPPAYSALKVKGKKLYEYARKGVHVEVEPRKITIYNIEVLNISVPDISIKVSCSKGTYIRQLCADIGEKLGCGAHLTALRRTASGDFRIVDALSFDALRDMDSKRLSERLIPYEDLARDQ